MYLKLAHSKDAGRKEVAVRMLTILYKKDKQIWYVCLDLKKVWPNLPDIIQLGWDAEGVEYAKFQKLLSAVIRRVPRN